MIKQFNKTNLPDLRRDINRALEELGRKHGISLSAGNARFTTSTVTFKLECAVNGQSGEIRTKEMVDLATHYPKLVNAEITMPDGIRAKVVGYRTRARKNPFIVATEAGKEYVVPSFYVFN